MSVSPRVTWLLPVRNGMPFLPETLASIEAQTFTNGQVLAWDNGSTDGTVDVLRDWIPARLPGRVVSDRPMGLGASLAAMVTECETELCARIDADDICLPERLERQIAYLDAHPEVAAVGTATRRLDAEGRDGGPFHDAPARAHPDIVHRLLFDNPISHPTVLMRRAAILDAGNYRDVGPVNIEDYDLWLRLARRHKMANLPDALLLYRVHPKSATQISIRQGELDAALLSRFAEHAPALFGLPPEEARLLRRKRHPFALGAFDRIARHLTQTQGERAPFQSASFVEALHVLTAPDDVRTPRFLPLRTEGPRALPGLLAKEARRVGGKVLRRLGLRRPAPPPPDHFTAWRAEQNAHAFLHPTAEWTGRAEGWKRVTVAPEVHVERDVTFWLSPDTDACLHLGRRSFVGRSTYFGVFQLITVGDNALIGAYCYLISANHVYARRDVPIREQGLTGAPIVINDDVWLGTHVVVLPGVTIGQGAIVAAGSVVTKDIPPYEVWGGVPARFLKARPE